MRRRRTQTLRKGPVGSGYLVPEGPDASFMSASLQALHAGGLPLLAGMTAVAGLFQGLLSQGLYRLRMLFPPGCGCSSRRRSRG